MGPKGNTGKGVNWDDGVHQKIIEKILIGYSDDRINFFQSVYSDSDDIKILGPRTAWKQRRQIIQIGMLCL